METLFNLLSLIHIDSYTEPEVIWDEEEETVLEPVRKDNISYLDRGENRTSSLRREKQERETVYHKPVGVLEAMLKACKKRGYSWEMVEKAVGLYIKGLMKSIICEDEKSVESENMLRKLLKGFCIDEGFKVEKLPWLVRIERNNGNNTFLHLVDVPRNEGKTKWVYSAEGLKKRRVGCSLRSHDMTFFGYEQLVFPVLYNFFKEQLQKGDNTAELLKNTINKHYLDAFSKDDDRWMLFIFPTEWDSESRKALVEHFRSQGIMCDDRDNYPGMYQGNFCRIYISRERCLSYLVGRDVTLSEYTYDFDASYSEEAVFSKMLSVLKTEDEADAAMANYSKIQGHTAKVWQTLKNHTDINKESALRSGFTKYFGLVELDHECELNKVEEDFYKDFEAIVETYLGGWHDKTCQLRIRKLGRHHALGLFFPGLWCLCVDLRSPSSMMHEFGHLYDYAHGELSRKWEFYDIRNKYISLLNKACEGKEKDMFGSSKYGLSYYSTPTEVFARCFEIWLMRVCNVNNNVVKEDSQMMFAYPKDEELLGLIRNYFDREFGRNYLPDEEKEDVSYAACAAR